MKTLKLFILPVFLSAFLVLLSATNPSKEIERIHDSANVLKAFGKMKESIPHDLLESYQGVVIIPNLLNAGFGIGAKRGKGVAMV